jgi:hypothetical protein
VLALVSYWSATKIILSVKVKVFGGGLCAYGWVTILLYRLWKNEHVSLFSNRLKPIISSQLNMLHALVQPYNLCTSPLDQRNMSKSIFHGDFSKQKGDSYVLPSYNIPIYVPHQPAYLLLHPNF